MELPSIEKLRDIVADIQKIMRIQDWDISIKLLSAREMNSQYNDCNITGYAYRNVKLNTATIYLNKDNLGDKNEWYATLIHELFHVQSTLLISTAEAYLQKEYDYFNTIYESYTERLAQMFVNIYPVSNFIKEGDDVGQSQM